MAGLQLRLTFRYFLDGAFSALFQIVAIDDRLLLLTQSAIYDVLLMCCYGLNMCSINVKNSNDCRNNSDVDTFVFVQKDGQH